MPIERERIRLKTNCGVPPLDRPDSRLCMMGIQANTVVPNGDTIAGLKYIARRYVGDCYEAEQLSASGRSRRASGCRSQLARKTAKELALREEEPPACLRGVTAHVPDADRTDSHAGLDPRRPRDPRRRSSP